MTVVGRDDIDLMLHHDRQLGSAEAAEVELQLKGSPADRAKLTALGQVGEVVRTHLELAADDAETGLDGLWARVERGLAEAEENPEVESAAAAAARERDAGPRRGWWAALWSWLDDHRGHFMTGAVTAGAVAALILVFRPAQERVVTRTVQAPARVELSPVSTPAEVEYLDVEGGTGTVLTLPGEGDDDSTTVLWIDPNDDNVEGPI